MFEIPGLPPIYQACPDCPSDADRADGIEAHAKARDAFDKAEKVFYIAFFEERPHAGYPEAASGWRGSDAHGPLYEAMQATEMPPEGCVECDFTGEVLTGTGRALSRFINQQVGHRLDRMDQRMDGLDTAAERLAEDLDGTSRRFGRQLSDMEYR